MHAIYLITNHANNKLYVGQTSTTAELRWKNHVYSKRKQDHFHAAISKYGKQSFSVETLVQADSKEEADTFECLWILALRTYDPAVGYNRTFGGDGGAIPTKETREKIGAYSRQRIHTPETRVKMQVSHLGTRNHFFGKKHKPETIEAMKIVCREKLSGEKNPWFGKKLSPEHRSKISLAKKGKRRGEKSKPLPEAKGAN